MSNLILKTNQFESILIERAKGSWIIDVNGKKYLDCESGMWCCNLGHNHPEITEVIKNNHPKLFIETKDFSIPLQSKLLRSC